jgi:hypothetical protein
MRRSLTVVAMLVVLAVACVAPAGAQTGNAKPKATEIGVTPTEIHVATAADVDNPFVPGLFKGAEVGAQGAAKYLNSKQGGGGIAGRKIVVDFTDSKLNANEARNAVISACQQDLALVGGAMTFLTTAEDEVSCPDQAGATTGLPDLSGFTVGIDQSCSPVAYPLNPPQIDCATRNSTPQKFTANAGIGRWLVKTLGKTALHGAFVYGTDTKDVSSQTQAILKAVIATGVKDDQYIGLSARTLQAGYTPVVGGMKSDNSNFALPLNGGIANMKAEAALQGVSDDVIWVGTYSREAAKDPTLEGTVAWLRVLPFEEGSSNAMLRTYLKYVPSEYRDQYSVFAWAAMLAFADAARAVVAKDGVNGLTRKALLDTGMPTLTKFDAGGMIGTTNIYKRIPSPCYLVERLRGGKYERVYPKKKGTYDCKPSNLVTVEE